MTGAQIIYHKDRLQPYTVWLDDTVLGFERTRGAAERRLLRQLGLLLDQRRALTAPMRAMVAAAMEE